MVGGDCEDRHGLADATKDAAVKSELSSFLQSEARATALAREHLSLLGWMIVPPEALTAFEWEATMNFRKRLGISHSHFARRLEHPLCPKFERQTGPKGNITRLRSNFDLDRHMMKVPRERRPRPCA